jgi:hypothetical protein
MEDKRRGGQDISTIPQDSTPSYGVKDQQLLDEQVSVAWTN